MHSLLADRLPGSRSDWTQRVAHLMLLLSVVIGSGALTACSITPDKRILQMLNTEGFGHPYAGNAELENYVTVGDRFTWVDELEKERNGQELIDVDGSITLPEVGTLYVAGMTRSELESYMTQRFSAVYTETSVKVLQLDARANKFYYVVGEVPQPGPKKFLGSLTVFDAVLTASPDEATANLSRVKLIRPDPVDPIVVTIDLKDIYRYGDTTYNILLQERDIIYIPPTVFGYLANFLVAVTAPFSKVFQTFTQALLGANRFNRFGGGRNNNNGGFNVF